MTVIVLLVTGKLCIIENVFSFMFMPMPSSVLIPLSTKAVEVIFDTFERLFIF